MTQSSEITGLPRTVKRQVTGRPAVDGAGVRLVRVLGSPTVVDFDPFLLLDAFDSTNPNDYIRGFPMHPHRGIETVTYLVEGLLEHKDSLGNQGRIASGGCQWMTAGRGILHQEMPQPSPRMLGLQLWVNLGRKDKMCPPKYRDITPDMLPRVQEKGVSVGVLSGEYKGMEGAMRADYVPVTFLDVRLRPWSVWTVRTEPRDTVFAYILNGGCNAGPVPPQDAAGGQSGAGYRGASPLDSRQAVLFTPGDSLTLTGCAEGAHLVLLMGTPLREPVAWGGPIVMNSDEELRQAFYELEAGTFIRE